MKKILIIPIITALCFLSTSTIKAKGFIDPYFTSIATGHAKTQTGAGVGIGFNFLRDWYFVSKFTYSMTELDSGAEKYNHQMYMAGIEYNHTIIPRLSARGTIMLGYSATVTEVAEKTSDAGPNFGAWLGAIYDINQWFSPFIDFGYHKSLYADEFKNKTIAGYQIMIGARFVIFGQNQSILTDY